MPSRLDAPAKTRIIPLSVRTTSRSLPPGAIGIGDGFHSALSDIRSRTVVYSPGVNEKDQLYTPSGSTGQTVAYNMREVSQFEELKEVLEIDAAASFGFGLFSSNLSYEFYRSAVFNRYSTFLQIGVVVENPIEVLRSRVLNDEALRYLDMGDDMFIEQCGDQFVQGRQTGGSLSAIVQISSRSSGEFETNRADVQASIAAFSSGELSISQTIERIAKFSDVRRFILRDGGLGPIPNLRVLAEYAEKFPDIVGNPSTGGNPSLFRLFTAAYNSVQNLPRPIDFGFISKQQQDLQTLASWLDRTYMIRGNLTYIATHKSEFSPESIRNIDDVWRNNEQILQTLRRAAYECRRDPAKFELPELPNWMDLEPQRKDGGTPPPPPPKETTPRYIVISQEYSSGPGRRPPAQTLYEVPSGKYAVVRVEEARRGNTNQGYILQIGTGTHYTEGSFGGVPKGTRHVEMNSEFTLVAGEAITLELDDVSSVRLVIKILERD